MKPVHHAPTTRAASDPLVDVRRRVHQAQQKVAEQSPGSAQEAANGRISAAVHVTTDVTGCSKLSRRTEPGHGGPRARHGVGAGTFDRVLLNRR